MRVLIADDDAISRRLIANMLAGWGYEVTTTANGVEAWNLLQQPDAPYLAILDWMMPGMTGTGYAVNSARGARSRIPTCFCSPRAQTKKM